MTSSAAAILEATDLAVGFGAAPILRLPALALRKGRITAIHGPSGGGKTTLLRTLAALTDPHHGEMRLEGRTPAEVGWPHYRRAVSLVAQQPVLFPGTVETNLRRPFAYHSARGEAFDADRAARLLESLGLGAAMLSAAARTLSVGEQLRVSLVRALLVGPAALLLDEPTSALDPNGAEQVERLLRTEASESGRAILVSTHQVHRMGAWCDEEIDLRPFTVGGDR